MIQLKHGVNPFSLRPELLLAIIIFEDIFKHNGHDLVITSLCDGVHSKTSLHYDGKAVDIRTKGIGDSQQAFMIKELRKALADNPDYDIVREDDHIHIEYQPKYRGIF